MGVFSERGSWPFAVSSVRSFLLPDHHAAAERRNPGRKLHTEFAAVWWFPAKPVKSQAQNRGWKPSRWSQNSNQSPLGPSGAK